MMKKMIVGATAAGLIVAGAASAAQLDTSAVSDTTLAEGNVTVEGATLEGLSFGSVWSQDFAQGTDGFVTDGGYGAIRADNGVGIVNGVVDSGNGNPYGPFSRLGGYGSTWPGTWTASMDVYLDPAAWSEQTGFTYSVAASGTDGGHQTDFGFRVAKTSDGVKVGANTGSDHGLGQVTSGGIVNSGWYTFAHTFRNVDGKLAVDMTVADSTGTQVFSKTVAGDGDDLIPSEVGGNRYLWFTHVSVDDLKIDNVTRSAPTPQGDVTGMTVDLVEGNVFVRATMGGTTTGPVLADANGIAQLPIPASSIADLQGPITLVVTSNA